MPRANALVLVGLVLSCLAASADRGRRSGSDIAETPKVALEWPVAAQACPRYDRVTLSSYGDVGSVDFIDAHGDKARSFGLQPAATDPLTQILGVRRREAPLAPPILPRAVVAVVLHTTSGRPAPRENFKLSVGLGCAKVSEPTIGWGCDVNRCNPGLSRELKREQPVGGQFLSAWRQRLPAAGVDGPPLLFMLRTAELRRGRYDWELPALVEAMAKELSAVLAEGCNEGCGSTMAAVKARLSEFADASDSTSSGAHARRWRGDDPAGGDYRQFGIRVAAGTVAMNVRCTCHSEPLGMRMWNDLTTCDATLEDHGRPLLTYSPRVRMREGKEGEAIPLDDYVQTVTLPDGGELSIETGYAYKGDAKNTRLQRGEVRGRIRWSGSLVPVAR